MNRKKVITAAYFAVLAIDQEPTRRSVQAMAKRICGKALHTDHIAQFLKEKLGLGPIRVQDGIQLGPVGSKIKHETETIGSDSVPERVPSCAPDLKEYIKKDTDSVDTAVSTPSELEGAKKPISVPWGLAEWFLAEAKAMGLIAPHVAAEEWCKRELKAASVLLANGPAECQVRARRYLAARASRKLDKGAASVRGLLTAWDFGCVLADATSQAAGPDGNLAVLAALWASDPEHDAKTRQIIASDQRVADRVNGVRLAS